jgi:predicted nucleic acid-binding protein
MNPGIAARAAQIRATHGLRTPDAIHAATALQSGASGIVTNDAGFRRLENETNIWLFKDIS